MEFSKVFIYTTFTFLIAFIMILTLSSCNQNETEPLLGDIVVVVNRSGHNGVEYRLYSELYLTSNFLLPPLVTGTIQGGVIEIKGINHGNYVLELGTGTGWRFFLQATAGKERRFEIN